MKKLIKKSLAVILTALMLMSTVPITVSAAEATADSVGAVSGTTGDCTWTFENGVLTISGNGAMADTKRPYYEPWHYCDINTVEIRYGVTHIGALSFYEYTSLKSVSISKSVTSIGNCAFGSCSTLTEIFLPDSVTSIGYNAFYRCNNLKKVNYSKCCYKYWSFCIYRVQNDLCKHSKLCYKYWHWNILLLQQSDKYYGRK